MTQLVIETVSVALFLLAFQHLPSLKRHGETKGFRLGNFIVAASVGITVTLVALIRTFTKTDSFYFSVL